MCLNDFLSLCDENMDVAVIDWYTDRRVGGYDGRDSVALLYGDCEVRKFYADCDEAGHIEMQIYIDADIEGVVEVA